MPRRDDDRIAELAQKFAEGIGPACARSLAEASRRQAIGWYRRTRRHSAFHEAGHALAAVVLRVCDVKSIRIDPRFGDVGRVDFHRDVPKSYARGVTDYWRDRSVVSMAGPCAESQAAKYDEFDIRGYGQPDLLWTYAHERGTGAVDFLMAYHELFGAGDIEDKRWCIEEAYEERILSPLRKPRPAERRTWLRTLELLKGESHALEAVAQRLIRGRRPLDGDQVARIVAANRPRR